MQQPAGTKYLHSAGYKSFIQERLLALWIYIHGSSYSSPNLIIQSQRPWHYDVWSRKDPALPGKNRGLIKKKFHLLVGLIGVKQVMNAPLDKL